MNMTVDKFAPGESVWVSGWPKSKAATYRLVKVDRDGTVQVWRDHRGHARMHSVTADRLGKRRDRR